MSPPEELPRGTVTFLFTDIEGSTRLLKQLREGYGEVLAEHRRILRGAFAEHGGREIDTQGDSFFAAFPGAKDAVAAAVAAQRRLAENAWPEGADLRVRMGLHTGEPTVGEERYVGLGVHRGARILAAGHGGQILVSQTTRELLRDDPLPDLSLRDLGEYRLKDLDEPERIYQLVVPGLTDQFPPLKTAAAGPFEGREGELVEAAQDAVAQLQKPWWRNLRVLVIAGVVVAALGVALGVLLVNGGGTASASDHVNANAVGFIDATSGKIGAQIGVGDAPSGVAVGDGALWVSNSDGNSVSRIDPKTNAVRQTIPVGGGPTGIAAHGGAVWVANGLEGTVARIDTATNQVVQTISVGNGPTGVAYGEKAIWVANSVDGTLVRLAPDTGRVTRTVAAVIGATGVAVGFHRLWVVSGSTGTVVALSPRSEGIPDRIAVGVDPAAVTVSADAVWVANRADGTVSRIDPRTISVIDTIQVGRAPSAIAAGSEGVWVANAADGTLSRIDASTDRVVETVRIGNPPEGLAVTPDGVYVAVSSAAQTHRGGTLRVESFFGVDFIDPALAYNVDSWSILSTTNDGLVGFRRVGGVQGIQLVPDLAVSLPAPGDTGTSYTFRIRPNIHYSNGKLVQPEDFRRAIERVFEVRPPSPGTQYYSDVVGARRCRPVKPCDLSAGIVTDRVAGTVTFHLTAPDADFLTKLALPFAVSVPAGTLAHVVKRPLPATGPYRIVSWSKGRSAKLVRNRRFREWSADAQPTGFPDVIEWKVRGAAADRIGAVKRGGADVALTIDIGGSKQELDELATQYPRQLHLNTQAATHYFFLNTRAPPFDDVRVRRAVNYAFDRQAYADLLGRGYAPTCQILPPNFPGYRRTCPYLPNGAAGLGKARALVRKSGTTGATVTVWMPVGGGTSAQGAFMVSVLKSLGYRARLRLVPPNKYFPGIMDSRLRMQAGFHGWASDYPSESGFLQRLFTCADFTRRSPERTSDPSEFCDRSIDRQIARAEAVQAQDPPAASVLWQQVERDVLARAPIVPTANPKRVDFISKRVANYQFHPQWGALLDQLWLR